MAAESCRASLEKVKRFFVLSYKGNSEVYIVGVNVAAEADKWTRYASDMVPSSPMDPFT